MTVYWQLIARLWYLQCISHGDTTATHHGIMAHFNLSIWPFFISCTENWLKNLFSDSSLFFFLPYAPLFICELQGQHNATLYVIYIFAVMTKSCWYSYTALCMGNPPRGPSHWRFLTRNSDLITDSFCCISILGHQIATIFCTCHDSTAAVACAKFCSDPSVNIWMRGKLNLRRIWIMMENR